MESSQWENWKHLFCHKLLIILLKSWENTIFKCQYNLITGYLVWRPPSCGWWTWMACALCRPIWDSSVIGGCQHGPLEENRDTTYLKKGSSAHNSLRSVVMDKYLVNRVHYYLNCRYLCQLCIASSPRPKGHLMYCHHLASVIRSLTFSHFVCGKVIFLQNRNKHILKLLSFE